MNEEVRALLGSEVGEQLAVYFEKLEERVALLEQQMNPPEPDPLEVGTEVFRQTLAVKNKALRRA